MTKITIVTVVLNGVDTIAQTIESVKEQTHKNVEHIVIDGGSTDGTLDVIERHRNSIAKLVVEPDEGLYDAMNKGIQLATGDVIGTLNSDDYYANDLVLEKVGKVFQEKSIEACFANLLYVDKLDTEKVVRYWKSQSFQPGLFEKGWIPAHPTFFVRREVYEKFGGFDLTYRYQSDFELSLRFLELHRIRSKFIPEIFVIMRIGGTTNRSVSNVIKGNLESYRACKLHGLKVTPLFFVVKFLSRVPQFFNRPR
ncbi:glycosyltransferase family 2 protein [Pseudomonadota bacterium]